MGVGPYNLRFVDTPSSRDAHKDVLSAILAAEKNGREPAEGENAPASGERHDV